MALTREQADTIGVLDADLIEVERVLSFLQSSPYLKVTVGLEHLTEGGKVLNTDLLAAIVSVYQLKKTALETALGITP